LLITPWKDVRNLRLGKLRLTIGEVEVPEKDKEKPKETTKVTPTPKPHPTDKDILTYSKEDSKSVKPKKS